MKRRRSWLGAGVFGVAAIVIGMNASAVHHGAASEDDSWLEGAAHAAPPKKPAAKPAPAKPAPAAKPSASAARPPAPSASAASSPSGGPPNSGPPRKPNSGSCNNSDNKCGGSGETCINNLCYCEAKRGQVSKEFLAFEFRRCEKTDDGGPAYNCTDVATTEEHCGACGRKCPSNQTCEDGKCRGCKRGETVCDGVCVNLLTDDSNCGKCGRECPSSFICRSGSCRL